MARLPRLNLPNIPQHVVQRGNNRQACFFAEQDYLVYLDKLKEYSKKYQVAVHAYVLMTNHVHLLMTPTTEKGVSQLMQSLGRYYVRYVNQTYHRSGTLWEGRYKSTLINSEQYFLLVSRYIELNPVRAAMVNHPAEYPWSSFQGNALDKNIELLTSHSLYLALGNKALERKKAYQALFSAHVDELALQEIRDATNKAWVLGDSRFKQQIEQDTGRRASHLGKGGDRKSKIFLKSIENQ
ncbi:transposase [Colwellia sp. PAMC 20917]|uniref:transposase n=1 Tax=Colwellia sp. PAMC 20917 TaxID=1816218 RepID=UPI0008784531|nr:transposase [Colwellia sp. PAMC 20917]AOW78603.1 transposase [Colwellia sp. PAMC 20917]